MQRSRSWKYIPPNPLVSMFGGALTGSYLLNLGDFSISYNAGTDQGEETALIKDSKFYILLGDHRKHYEELAPQGFEACLLWFSQCNHPKSPWSAEAPEQLKQLELKQ